MTIVDSHRSSCSFQHDAFIYESSEAYLDALVPLIDAGLDAGDAIFAVVPAHNAELLRAALGSRADAVEFIDAETWYEHPIETIDAYTDVLAALPDGQRAFVVGEVQFGSTDADWAAWTRYEAALNHALGHANARVICPYDVRALSASVISDARRTHPYLVTEADAAPSPEYHEPTSLLPHLPPTVSIPATVPALDLAIDGDLQASRRAFAGAASEAGVEGPRLDELTLALNEILTNAIVHGGGAARLRVWLDLQAGSLTCVIDDDGAGAANPLLGYTRPPEPTPGGYGTWLARRLFDRCEFMRSDSGGLRVVLIANV